MNNQILIGSRPIGRDFPPFIIAEMSGNHNQCLDKALEIVDQAAFSGAHAIKLQTYTADSITLNSSSSDFQISDKNSPWNGANLLILLKFLLHGSGMLPFSSSVAWLFVLVPL